MSGATTAICAAPSTPLRRSLGGGVIDKPLPSDTEAERGVVGALILAGGNTEFLNGAMRWVDKLHPSAFTSRKLGTAYQAIRDLYERGEAIDTTTVSNALQGKRWPMTLGEVSEVVDHVPNAQSLRNYAAIVERMAVLRGIITAAHEIQQGAFSYPGDVPEFASKARDRMITATDTSLGQMRVKHVQSVVSDVVEDINRAYKGEDTGAAPIPTGLRDIDDRIGGLLRGVPTLIAARPGHGKSAFCKSVALRQANAGHGQLIIGLEDSPDNFASRMLAEFSGIDGAEIMTRRVSDWDGGKWAVFSSAAARLSSLPIYFYDSPSSKVTDVEEQIHLALANHPEITTVWVDYVQFMDGAGQARGMYETHGELAKRMTLLAKATGKALACMAQFNREIEKRTDKTPMTSDVEGGGVWDRMSRTTIYLRRLELWGIGEIEISTHHGPRTVSTTGRVAVDVMKSTHIGGLGTIVLEYDKAQTGFRDYDPRRDVG